VRGRWRGAVPGAPPPFTVVGVLRSTAPESVEGWGDELGRADREVPETSRLAVPVGGRAI